MMDGVLGAAKSEAAAVAIYDAGGDPETEAGAVEVLGGIEGFEDAFAYGGRHAVAGVGDGDADTVNGRRGVRRSSPWRRVRGREGVLRPAAWRRWHWR